MANDFFRVFSKLFSVVSADMAIDLGTANTLVYVKDKGIVLKSHIELLTFVMSKIIWLIIMHSRAITSAFENFCYCSMIIVMNILVTEYFDLVGV